MIVAILFAVAGAILFLFFIGPFYVSWVLSMLDEWRSLFRKDRA